MPDAFTKSLQRRPAGKVKMLRQHDPEEPIGIWLDLAEDKQGLAGQGQADPRHGERVARRMR